MELRDYLRVLRVRMWTVVYAVVVVTVTALVVSLVQSPSYMGEAKVLVSEKDTGAALFGTVLPEFSAQPERGLQTQVQLMQLRPLAEATIKRLDLQVTPEELLDRVAVNSLGQTNIVRVRATSGDPERAAAIANSIAEGYVSWSRDSKRESLRAARVEVEKRLEEAKEEILELGRRIDAEGKSDDLAAELAIATGAYTTLAEKLEQLRINEELEVGSGRVVSAAVVDPDPVAPNPMRNTLLGVVVGLMFGVGMAFLNEYLDNTLKSTEEVERLLDAPVLGHVPLERFEKGETRRLTIVQKPGSPAAEAYRVLRNSLDFVNFEHDIRTVVVTSAAPGEGKSTVAANLAASLAQAGSKVALVSCDFRRPTTEQFFGIRNMIGLSDVLTGAHSMKAALQRPGDEHLLVMTSGKMPPNPSELLGSKKMEELIRNLEEWADWVIIDTPPLLAVADPAAVARWSDGVLLVTRAGASTRDALVKARQMLDKVGARVIGSVIWGIEHSGSSGSYYSGYYGHYYYADYYSADERGGSRGQPDSGARSSAAQTKAEAPPDMAWVPAKSPGRRVAEFAGRVMAGVLGFMVVIAIAAVVAYFLAQYMGVDILAMWPALW